MQTWARFNQDFDRILDLRPQKGYENSKSHVI